MASLNKVLLIGNLGQDPDIKYTKSNLPIASFSVATTDNFTDENGEKKTEWHRVVLFKKLAEVAEKYLRKGMMVYIEGRIQTRKYTDKSDQQRTITEIVGNSMQILTRKGEQVAGGEYGSSQSASNKREFDDVHAESDVFDNSTAPFESDYTPKAKNFKIEESDITEDDLPF